MRYVNYGGHLGVIDNGDVLLLDDVVASGERADGPVAALIERLANDPDGTRRAVEAARDRATRQPYEASQLRAPLPRPGKLIAAPVNYADHKQEMKVEHSVREYGLFLKATSSIVGPGEPIQLPYPDVRTDQEGELAVVVGRQARNVAVQDAHEYVFGYTCAIDVSLRSTEDRSTRKSFDTFTPLGPAIVTTDEIVDDRTLELECFVNGERRQRAVIGDMIFGVPDLITYASSVMTLWPGDVILTGTPAGVGPLAPGDVVEVTITQIGTLTSPVRSGSAAVPYAQRPSSAVLS
jgi:2-keto-4-pentenoate hydratase/2-oxohepta-3-ene-1,7-dioic acid hydratase in catechol pathway